MDNQSKVSKIDFFISCLEKGETRGKVLAKVAKKWQISDRTFDRIWKTANEKYKERQEKAKAAADKAYIESMAEAAKGAVMSKAERQKILTDIARGDLMQKILGEKVGEVLEVPMPVETFERIKAIAELNKMEGDYAPAKTSLTDRDGNNLSIQIIQLPDNGRNANNIASAGLPAKGTK